MTSLLCSFVPEHHPAHRVSDEYSIVRQVNQIRLLHTLAHITNGSDDQWFVIEQHRKLGAILVWPEH
jgi:hypothetical protein